MHLLHRRDFLIGAAALGASCALPSTRPSPAAAQTCGARTEPNIEGPFFRAGAPARTDLVVGGEAGRRLWLDGQVLDGGCRPVPGAVIEVWHADAAGGYDNAGFGHRGVLRCDAAGRYRLRTIVPGRYRLSHTYRPAHIHVKVHGVGHDPLTTQLYFAGDPYNDDDPWFRTALLVRESERAAAGVRRAGFDFRL